MQVLAVIAALTMVACGGNRVDGLRESFTQQLSANRFISDVKRSGEDVVFSGPGAEGGVATWRVHIDSVAIEPGSAPGQPEKGVVKSSWYSDGKIIRPRGADSNLPIELTSTGLAQECWALWNTTAAKWSWE